MKKLMIALAAAATTMFSFGDDDVLPHGADFEANGYVAGENFTNYVNKADDGVATSDNRYWYSTSDDIGVISNHAAALDVPVPDLYKDATPKGGDNFLQLDTQAPLFRKAVSNNKGGAPEYYVSMSEGDGVYLDTLVKFTAADEPFGTNSLEAVDKIAIEYVEREDDDSTPEVNEALTNFVVRAGFIVSQNQLVATNYVVALPEGWLANNKKDDWHRLTVRSLTNIDEYNRVGFKIYLDEAPLVYLTDKDEFAQSAGIDDGDHVIFPSAVETDKNNYDEISAVAFSGNGSIDDVVFTTNKPIFIAKSEAVVVPFVADAGVTAISVEVDDNEVTNIAVTAAGTYAATLEAQTANFTVNVTVDEANGYTLGSISYNGNPVVNGEVTGYTGGDITITTIRNNFNLFDADGNAITTGAPFQTLGAALAATGVAKIQLAHDYDVVAADIPDGYIDLQQSITLDLNGKILDGGESLYNPLFMVNEGNFVIIDSVGGGKVVYDGPGIVYGASSYIGAVSGDLGPTFDGKLFFEGGEGNVVRGKFDETSNTTSSGEPAFLWEAYLGDGDSVTSECKGLVSGYWVVEPEGTPQPTTYAISWTLTGGTTEATAGDFEENATIVFTADTGKTLSFVSIDGTEIADTSVYGANSYTYTVGTDDAELVVTFSTPAPTTYAISWTLTGGTTEATAGDFEENATIVFTADTGKTLSFVSIDGTEIADTSVYGASSYTYTVGTAAATLVVTFTGSSYPSYIDDATEQGKYDTWKAAMTAAGVDVGDGEAYEDAYLLNCKPAEVTAEKAAFKFTSISYDTTESKWVTTTTVKNTSGADYNGTVTVTGYSDVGCTVGNETEAGPFFKASLQ